MPNQYLLIILAISIVLALLFVIALTIFVAILLGVLIFTRVPFVKTPKKVIDRILNEVAIKPTDTVYDLGCGDAQFLIEVEKRTAAKTIGFELSPWAYFLANLSVFLHHSKTKVSYKNFYKENLSDADVIFCFLIDSVMPKVQKLLEKQLKKGAQVISFAFPIKEWTPIKTINPDPQNPKASKIYFYQR